jgi:hypothetical protein
MWLAKRSTRSTEPGSSGASASCSTPKETSRRQASTYREFVEQWKDADPALQPQVAEVRARLERIAEEMRRRG